MPMEYKKIQCIIVDDEPLARDIIENFILRIDNLELVTTCSNAYEAFNVLHKNKIDLIFLDIHMPELTGIEFLKDTSPAPLVVFTTAHDAHAIEAYDLDAVDYLLKPIEFSRFLKSINKVYRQLDSAKKPSIDPGNEDGPSTFIYLKIEKKMQKIYVKDILFIESIKNYIKVTTGDRKIVAHKNISAVMNLLPRTKFLRVHRSFIVGVDYIDSFSPSQIEIKGTKIPVGRKYREEVKHVLGYF